MGTVPAVYLYPKFDSDENLLAFVANFNDAAQTYVDWMSNVGAALAYYPALSGPLLDWVAQGRYDTSRPTIGTVGAPGVGMLDTQLLDTFQFNPQFGQPSAGTYYGLSDDSFQRVLTWNNYVGDGPYFDVRWLKRRIMRFFVGVNGQEPTPWDMSGVPGAMGASYGVGTEDTTAISVAFAAGTCTVTIAQATLMSLVPGVTEQLISDFHLLFLSGVLLLPGQYSYAVTLS